MCLLIIIILFLAIIIFRTISFKNNDNDNLKELNYDGVDFTELEVHKKLSEAVKVKTISNSDYSKTDWNEFVRYHELLEKLFPRVHSNLDKNIVNDYSLVYHWRGKNTDRKPILITAHMDVVPIEVGTEGDWDHEPFSGDIADGYVWGRGTIDTKEHMIASLEAAERLLEEDYVPNRDIYFAFGHDEEVGGRKGAAKIVEYFIENNIEFEYLVDEGGCVTEETIKEVSKPIALIGIGEKGYANIKVSVSDDGGHGSMPPKHTALGKVAKAINNLEENQCPLKLTKPVKEFLLKIGPEMGFTNKLILSNLWLFKNIFLRIFSKTKTGNAMLRTTTAATMAEASMEPNVLPQRSFAIFNFRIRPEENGKDLLKHIKRVNKDIPIEVDVLRLEEPSMISDSNSQGFKNIEAITKYLYKDVIVAPYLVMAGTDARKYEPVCKNIYRFTPFKIHNDEMSKIHGTNENLSIENINNCLKFFYILFREC
ncbi:MAG: M20/M25/M40 family metallo-hydrolase [Maledivibacter sp.]|nr:M20/M25/M40 family metallo-hydrolase [Maledivibacter sp.]